MNKKRISKIRNTLFNYFGFIYPHTGEIIGDKLFLKILYRLKYKKRLDFSNPKSFCEKVQWLKIYNRNDEYTKMVDKYTLKQYITDVIGEEYVIPCIGIWNSVDEIDFSTLPEKFAIKCTHDSGSTRVCTNKEEFDIEAVKKFLRNKLKRNYFWHRREYYYKNVPPRIICEQYMVDESGTELKDYKIWCFNGAAKLIQIDFNRFSTHSINVYDMNWNLLPFSMNKPSDRERQFDRLERTDEMIEIAERIAKDKILVRVDFFFSDNHLYIGELTFFPDAGFVEFDPAEYDDIIGEMLMIPI